MAPLRGDTTGVLAYRLGDCVSQYSQELNEYILVNHSGSIAAEYVGRTTAPHDLAVLNSIVDEKCAGVKGPEIAVHIRTGDALCDSGSAVNLRPAPVKDVCTVINEQHPHKDIRIFTGNHIDRCVVESRQYLDSILRECPVTLAPEESADVHFCQMINADLFVQGKGAYSSLVSRIRESRGQRNILADGLV